MPPDAAAAEYRSVQDITLERIRTAVVGGAHEPGSRLGVRELAQGLGVSAAPVREALKQLAAESLVEFRPRFGFFVRALSPLDVLEVYELRVQLERLAAGFSVPALTPADLTALAGCLGKLEGAVHREERLRWQRAFHLALYGAAGRPRLLAMIGNLWDSVEAHLRLIPDRTEGLADDCRQLLAAAQRKDARQVQAMLQALLEEECERLVAGLPAAASRQEGLRRGGGPARG